MFIALEQLKTTLEEMSSARQQVTDTVSAYNQTQSEIESYIQNFIGIENGLNDIIALLQRNKIVIDNQSLEAVTSLKKTCDKIIAETSNSLTNASEKFANTTKDKASALSVQIERFENTINRAKGTSSTIEKLSNDVLKTLSLISSLNEELTTTQHQQSIALNNISGSSNSLSEDVKQLNSLLQSIHSDIKKGNTELLMQLSQSKQVINNAITATNNNVGESTASIRKDIKTVQYIGYAILVEIAISVMIHFI